MVHKFQCSGCDTTLARLTVILRSEGVITSEFWYSLRKTLTAVSCIFHSLNFDVNNDLPLYIELTLSSYQDKGACMFLSCHVRVSERIHTLSDCKWTRLHNHLVRKRTLNHLAKFAKWFTCVVSTYLKGAFDCMFLSWHVRVSEWIHTL